MWPSSRCFQPVEFAGANETSVDRPATDGSALPSQAKRKSDSLAESYNGGGAPAFCEYVEDSSVLTASRGVAPAVCIKQGLCAFRKPGLLHKLASNRQLAQNLVSQESSLAPATGVPQTFQVCVWWLPCIP